MIREETVRLGAEVKAVGEIVEQNGIEEIKAEAAAITEKYRVGDRPSGGHGE